MKTDIFCKITYFQKLKITDSHNLKIQRPVLIQVSSKKTEYLKTQTLHGTYGDMYKVGWT